MWDPILEIFKLHWKIKRKLKLVKDLIFVSEEVFKTLSSSSPYMYIYFNEYNENGYLYPIMILYPIQLILLPQL